MILHDWFDWTNSGVGVVGLTLTLGALWQASGARRAAIQAREAVFGRNAAEAVAEIARLSERCVLHVQIERPKDAAVYARDLLNRIPRERERFKRFLGSDSDRLRMLEDDFRQLAEMLSSDVNGESRVATDAAVIASQELNAVCGRLLARIDEEES